MRLLRQQLGINEHTLDKQPQQDLLTEYKIKRAKLQISVLGQQFKRYVN